MPSYGLSLTLDEPFAYVVERTRIALAEQGFGVLTEIDVAATMKAKLGEDMPAQIILGACNPPLAHQALLLEPSIGLLLPCNVVIRSIGARQTLVETIAPDILVSATGNSSLTPVAGAVRERLEKVLDTLSVAPLKEGTL